MTKHFKAIPSHFSC